jgi:Domain of unknown function (DUF4136)
MRYHLASVMVAALAAITACGPTVSVQRAPDLRLAEGSRWAWAPPDRDGLTAAEGAMTPPDSVARMIQEAVDAELASQGFRRTSIDSAQFLVHFHVGQRAVTDTLPPRDDPPSVTRAPEYWGRYGTPEELGERLVSWEEGMLVIDAVTADRGIVAWRGMIAGEIPARAEMRPAAAIREAVRRLLRDFP